LFVQVVHPLHVRLAFVPTTLRLSNGAPGHATSPSWTMHDANGAGTDPSHTSSSQLGGGVQTRIAVEATFVGSETALVVHFPGERGN
jgi:hypothetical protein